MIGASWCSSLLTVVFLLVSKRVLPSSTKTAVTICCRLSLSFVRELCLFVVILLAVIVLVCKQN